VKKAPYKLHLKKDDIVQVISGKEKGKKGKVLAIFPAIFSELQRSRRAPWRSPYSAPRADRVSPWNRVRSADSPLVVSA
jgi:hypothetical protein